MWLPFPSDWEDLTTKVAPRGLLQRRETAAEEESLALEGALVGSRKKALGLEDLGAEEEDE